MAREAMRLTMGLIRRGGRFSAGEELALGLSCFVVTLPPEEGLRRRLLTGRAAKLLLRHGVRECACPRDFAFPAAFARRGLTAIDRRPLLRQKAAQGTLLARQAAGLTGGIAIASARVTAEVEQAAERLLRRTERVALLRCPGAERLQWRLRREMGASLRLVDEVQLSEAETLLRFDDRAACGRRLTLSPERAELFPALRLPPLLAGALTDAEEETLALLLWRGGRLRAEEIGLKVEN